MARRWIGEGAQRLHVVDLDGARDGVRANSDVIRRLLQAIAVPVQVGGGVRSLETAGTVLEEGADRVIVGTAALEDAAGLQEWLRALGADRLIVAVDGRN